MLVCEVFLDAHSFAEKILTLETHEADEFCESLNFDQDGNLSGVILQGVSFLFKCLSYITLENTLISSIKLWSTKNSITTTFNQYNFRRRS